MNDESRINPYRYNLLGQVCHVKVIINYQVIYPDNMTNLLIIDMSRRFLGSYLLLGDLWLPGRLHILARVVGQVGLQQPAGRHNVDF